MRLFNLVINCILLVSVSGNSVQRVEENVIQQLAAGNECRININGDLADPQPLLIVSGTTTFVEPKGSDGIIYLSAGQSIELFCTTSVTATCQSNGNFLINGKIMSFSEFKCSTHTSHSIRKTSQKCFNSAPIYEIGFAVGSRFLKILDICHDEVLESTIYVKYVQSFINLGYEKNYPRPSWTTGGFFGGKNVDQLYTKVNQIEMFTKILGSATLANQLVQTTGDTYLARGHLAAKVDFIYGSQQRATHYFHNVIPQWQKFNSVNWEAVEAGLRQLITSRSSIVDIYTGSFGVMTSADVSGVQKELYLYINGSGKGQIPVPKLIYKLAIERSTRLGIVLIGVNNVHVNLSTIASSYRICTDIGNRVNWIKWDKSAIAKGYMYACDVNEFLAVVRHLPGISASGLLV